MMQQQWAKHIISIAGSLKVCPGGLFSELHNTGALVKYMTGRIDYYELRRRATQCVNKNPDIRTCKPESCTCKSALPHIACISS